MGDKTTYSASLTGEAFLFYEIKQVARLKLSGFSDQEIREEVTAKNLFQYATEKRLSRRLGATIRRTQVLDDTLLRCLVDKPSETGRIINLYAIMKTNRLMFDFVLEVIGEKFESNQLLLEKRDINEFFLAKREQHEDIARWKDQTVKKLKQVIQKIVLEAGLLDEQDKCSLHRPSVDSELIKHMDEIADLDWLKAIGING